MESIKSVLMKRDKMSESEADDLIMEFKEEFQVCIENGSLEAAHDLIQDYFGLEADYLEEFLF